MGVMGSGSDPHRPRAEALGKALAALDVHLLTGGGRGVMEAVSRAFASGPGRRGMVLAVLPASDGEPGPPVGYPNEWIELAIRTHLPLRGVRGGEPMSRNHINVLTSDVIVALPGGPGTLSEVQLALDYGRPVVAHMERSDELPGLPASVRLASELTDVISFVQAVLEGG